ncbi:MAG: phosphotransferase, partial [Chloroflexi bacterium]|nr:phosphotransferase [Chloroflexota bacterium]
DGALSAIIDWEDAALGDPLADLGKSRLEILWAFGTAAMQAYSERYLELNGTLNAAALPFWDLLGAFRLSHFASFAPEPGQIPRMRSQYDAFVAAAIRRLEAL